MITYYTQLIGKYKFEGKRTLIEALLLTIIFFYIYINIFFCN